MRFVIPTCLLFLSLPLACLADQPPLAGNFSVPFSQQPAAFIAFGQNVVNKNETILTLSAVNNAGHNTNTVDYYPSIVYGITDSLSTYITLPYADYHTGNVQAHGVEDAILQLEDAFYAVATSKYTDTATIVGNMTLPTGSLNKDPYTGYGAPTFFLGTTFNRTYVDWIYYVSPGVIFTTAKNNSKAGNTYYYQAGIGKNMIARNGYILALMLEMEGTYYQKNRINGVIDNDTGGNVINLSPSFWFANKNLIIQLGVGMPVTQHLFGSQIKNRFLVAGSISWTIYS